MATVYRVIARDETVDSFLARILRTPTIPEDGLYMVGKASESATGQRFDTLTAHAKWDASKYLAEMVEIWDEEPEIDKSGKPTGQTILNRVQVKLAKGKNAGQMVDAFTLRVTALAQPVNAQTVNADGDGSTPDPATESAS